MKNLIKIDDTDFTLGEAVKAVAGMFGALIVAWGFLVMLSVI